MTSRNEIEETIRLAYAARVRGDIDAVLAYFTPDATFEFNGRGTGVRTLAEAARGADLFRATLQSFIDTFKLDDWKEVSLLVDGDKASLHWRARVTHAGTKKAETFDVFDLMTLRDGKISSLRQSTDTALVILISAP
jgi:ketosteroid isomerase-like protein